MSRLQELYKIRDDAEGRLAELDNPKRHEGCEFEDLSREIHNDDSQRNGIAQLLFEVKDAIRRTEKHFAKTGRDEVPCVGCGGAIEPERLKVVPTTPYCSVCVRKNGNMRPETERQFLKRRYA